MAIDAPGHVSCAETPGSNDGLRYSLMGQRVYWGDWNTFRPLRTRVEHPARESRVVFRGPCLREHLV